MCNPYMLYIILCMALCWSNAVMSVMCAAFYEHGIDCEEFDEACQEEASEMHTIKDEVSFSLQSLG